MHTNDFLDSLDVDRVVLVGKSKDDDVLFVVGFDGSF
jgi:hypothetical protein